MTEKFPHRASSAGDRVTSQAIQLVRFVRGSGHTRTTPNPGSVDDNRSGRVPACNRAHMNGLFFDPPSIARTSAQMGPIRNRRAKNPPSPPSYWIPSNPLPRGFLFYESSSSPGGVVVATLDRLLLLMGHPLLVSTTRPPSFPRVYRLRMASVLVLDRHRETPLPSIFRSSRYTE
ncbi:hypothetical protein BC826DRAFT_234170 [Russula brevipes]|nr:hypothetical protein BC826DRAFT_234170 [Russula brevipes]